MTLQIGRIPAIAEPMSWQNQGENITITGRLGAGGADGARILRDQLVGYSQNPDEPVIPIISTADSRLTGFYRILNVDVPTTPVLYTANGVIEYTIQAERVQNYAYPQLESFLTGALMVNDYGVAAGTAEPFHAYPGQAPEYTINITRATGDEARPLADGSPNSIEWVRMEPAYKGLARFALKPSDFYWGGCQLVGGTPSSHVIVGRQESVLANDWTLQNGLASVTWSGTAITAKWADGALNTYRTTATLNASGVGGLGYNTSAVAIRILRNAPEEVIIRVPLNVGIGAGTFLYTPAYCDVSLRRGSRIIRFYLVPSQADQLTFAHSTVKASTALTAGQVWTANDGFGNRVLMATAKVRTDDLVNGKITTGSPASAKAFIDIGLSMELNGAGSVGRDTAQSQVYQYLAAQAERMQVVGR